MIRKYLFSEEYGRNIIWPMLSGFFLKIGAKENIFGQIENLKVNLEELNLKATGKNTTVVLMNLTKIVKRLETNILKEKF